MADANFEDFVFWVVLICKLITESGILDQVVKPVCI